MLKLKELVWEITAKCNNGCDYCGSYCVTGLPDSVTDTSILAIANKLADYPPEEVNISGGDPTLIAPEVHEQVVAILRGAGIVPKIIVNPISIKTNTLDVFNKIIRCYDAVGVSINTEEEYKIFVEHEYDLPINIITFVTNFNKANLWLFDSFLDLASKHQRPWQVQLTMWKDPNDSAIYESELAIKELLTKLGAAKKKFGKVVLGDNINDGTCTAGMNTLGILSDGSVIPCLSMRAWVDNLTLHVQGNLHSSSLQSIWEDNFKDQRFRKFKCCGQHCKNITAEEPVFPLGEDINKDDPAPHPLDFPQDIVMLYGIRQDEFPQWPDTGRPPNTPPSIMVYAVATEPPIWPDFDVNQLPVIKYERTKKDDDEQTD